MREAKGLQDRAGLDVLVHVLQRNMDGRQDDPQAAANEQHAEFLRVGEVGEKFRVARVMIAGGIHHFLVDRRGHDRIGLAAHGHFNGLFDVFDDGLA